MLKKLFGRKQEEPEPGPQLAMPLFPDAALPTPRSIVAAWREVWPDEPALEVTEGEDEDVATLRAGESTAMFAGIGVPVPGGEVGAALETSWMFQKPREGVLAHKSHAVVATTMDPGQAVANACMVTRVVAAAVRAGDGVGVYWGSGGLVHHPEMFVDMAQSMLGDDGVPVPLWVGLAISAASKDGPLTLTTHGLRPFGHRELEVIDAAIEVGDLRMLAYDLAAYLLTNGPVLKHGDTFGSSETERMKVEHTTSRFRKGEPVLRLHV